MSYENEQRSFIPGPGAYNSKSFMSETSQFSFGKSGRTGIKTHSESPGPGKYSVPSMMCKEGRCPSISGRTHAIFQHRNIPGPGSYNPLYRWKNTTTV